MWNSLRLRAGALPSVVAVVLTTFGSVASSTGLNSDPSTFYPSVPLSVEPDVGAFPASVRYLGRQATDAGNNLIGTPNTPAVTQNFLFSGSSVTTQIGANTTPTFATFISAPDDVPFHNNRVNVWFADGGGMDRGSISAAIRTEQQLAFKRDARAEREDQ